MSPLIIALRRKVADRDLSHFLARLGGDKINGENRAQQLVDQRVELVEERDEILITLAAHEAAIAIADAAIVVAWADARSYNAQIDAEWKGGAV